MHCPSCGHENRVSATFCGACAASLAREIACPACGVANPTGQRFCDTCGRSLGPPEPTAADGARRPPAAVGGGRYQVRNVLGEGAKKIVYLAHDTRLDRDVAIAMVKTDGLDEAGLARVTREARAMGRLGDHPHVVTVHDVGEEAGRPYIVSEYMAGGSIDDLLARAEGRRLPLDQALRLAIEICDALDHAHASGVIHRDLKPGNVWLTREGTAKLGDFGLALALDRSRLTLEGMMVGTVAYMPPEQALGRAPDARSDLYALGAVLYEMVTGRPPFLGDDAVAVISQHINTAPVAPSWHNPDVPRTLDVLILRLLGKAPEERPEGAGSVRQALAAIAAPGAAAAREPHAGEQNPLDRLAGGVFVGREREMDELRAALESALSGRGQLVLLVGEPGIGKTRTAEELATYASLRKAQVLWGRCYEGDGAPAYWPWVQAIRAYAHEHEPGALRAELGSGAVHVAQIVSEVRERLPGLPEPPALGPDAARFQLFDGVTTFLRNASRTQPLVLVLDDLHWADKPSLMLLQFVARELRGARLLVIGTYRDVDIRRQHPLSQALGELAREQLAERIVLRGLGKRDVARFVEITTGLRPPTALVEAVYRETEGNPFFVNEVVRLLVSDGRLQRPERVTSWSVEIPQSVREVIGRRLDRLSPECNRVLTTAAVVGREFGLALLERVADLSEDRLLDVLEEALGARVVMEVRGVPDRYTFAHALIRETLYEELTATRRVRLHRRIGEALEALYGSQPEPHLAELAYHFCEAAQGGDVERAVAYAVRAAERAACLMAHEEAVAQYERALQVLEMRQPRADAERCELLLRLSESLWRAGEYERAKTVALDAAEIARRRGAAEPLARAALAYGGRLIAFAAVIRDETLVGLLEEALGALPEGDSPLRAHLLARLAEEVTFTDTYERREMLCRDATAIARRLGDPVVLAAVLRSAQWALWVPENLEERVAWADEVIALGRQTGDRSIEAEGHALRTFNLLEQSDVGGARREHSAWAGMVEELRQPYLRWAVAMTDVTLAAAEGRLGEIEARAQEALRLGQEAQNANAPLTFGIQMAGVYWELGRHEEAEALVTGFVGMFPAILPDVRAFRALLCASLGREAEARSELEELAADGCAALPRNLAWVFAVGILAETCARLGDERHARGLYDLLLPFARRNVTLGPVYVNGSVARYLGLLAALIGRREEAARHFEDAVAANARMGTAHLLARSQVEYAELLLADGTPAERSRALDLLNRAIETAQRLGMRPLVDRALAAKLRAQGLNGGAGGSLDAVVSLVERERPDLRSRAAPDGTVTILFTDIEGSTAMTERLGDHRAQEILHAHNRIVREQVAAHGGFEVKSQGDGFMVAFSSARRALACAIAIQRALDARAAPPDERLRVRAGLHTGEAIKEADDFFGKNVILAARIAAQAIGGEILVSSLLKELVESAGDVRFDGGRELVLKGLSGTHQVFAVAWAATAPFH